MDLEENKITPKKVLLTEDDNVIWGHPGIGKTYLKENRKDIFDFDTDFKPAINRKYNLEEGYKALNEWRTKNPELWNQEIRKLWIKALATAKIHNKKLVVSDMLILREFANDLDKVVTIPLNTFIERSKQRNDYSEGAAESWKANIDKAISDNIPKDKIISTEDYFSDIMTPVQNLTTREIEDYNLPDEFFRNPNNLGAIFNVLISAKKDTITPWNYKDFLVNFSVDSKDNIKLTINKITKEDDNFRVLGIGGKGSKQSDYNFLVASDGDVLAIRNTATGKEFRGDTGATVSTDTTINNTINRSNSSAKQILLPVIKQYINEKNNEYKPVGSGINSQLLDNGGASTEKTC